MIIIPDIKKNIVENRFSAGKNRSYPSLSTREME